MSGILPPELTRPIVRKTKKASTFLSNMKHPFRGGKVNYLGEPSFRAWIVAGIPFYVLAVQKRLPLWRWLLMVVPHIYLLDGEANNTAHEESIRSHRSRTWHFRNAMDSASFSVFLRSIVAVMCAMYALFAPDPWVADDSGELDLQEQLAKVIRERHLVSGELSTDIPAARRAWLMRKGKDLNRQEQILILAIRADSVEKAQQ